MGPCSSPLVLDTNVVLDLLVFDDPATGPLRDALQHTAVAWLSTLAMRDEFERVLTYPQIAARLQGRGRAAEAVLAQFDRVSQRVPAAPAAAIRCQDRDDQIFIDLAVAHRATLISKDGLVLRLRKRLAVLGVVVQTGVFTPPAG